MSNIYYIYAYIRSSDGTPYYIGKGKGDRAWNPKHSISVPKDKSKILIMESGLSEIGAFALERRYIRWYGRKDLGTGILRNKTDGGDGVSGLIFSEESRKKISKSLVGNKYSIGRKLTESHRKTLSQVNKGNTRNIGRTVSEQTRKKLSEAGMNRKHSDETRAKISQALLNCERDISAEKNPMYGKIHSTDTRKLIGKNSGMSRLGKKRGPYKKRLHKFTLTHNFGQTSS